MFSTEMHAHFDNFNGKQDRFGNCFRFACFYGKRIRERERERERRRFLGHIEQVPFIFWWPFFFFATSWRCRRLLYSETFHLDDNAVYATKNFRFDHVRRFYYYLLLSVNTTNMTKATTTTKRKKSGATLASPPFHLSSGDGDEGNNDSFPKVFEGVSRLLMGRKNIIVLVGAGISVSCGIPDFRSKDSGLYSTLDTEALGLSCPEELFDWEFFQEDPSPFYKFARNLYFPLGDGKKVEPSDSHKLLAMLEQKKMLLRVYSQNIDGLENVAGVSNRKMVYAHGSLQWATCCKCQHKVSCDEILPEISKGCVPSCQVVKKNKRSGNSATSSPANSPTPREPSRRSSTKKRQRTAGPDNVCGGVYKPAVTFFGETLHDNVRRTLESDRNKVDALIVIGTSLSV